MLETPPLNPRAQAFSVLQCNCWTCNDNIQYWSDLPKSEVCNIGCVKNKIDRCSTEVCPFGKQETLSTDHRGIRPSMDTSTYRHRDVGYGHSPKYDNAHRVQHRFITPGQHRHINISHRKSIHQPNLTPSLLPVLFVLLQRKKIIFKLFFYSSLKVTGDVKQNAQYNLPFFNLKPEKGEKLKTFLILKQDWL